MDRLKTMCDADLNETIRRLERDVQDFRVRAAKAASVLEREDRSTIGDPLLQRLTSIRNHLSEQLRQAQDEAARRASLAAKRPAWSFRAALAGLMGARG